MLQGGAQGQSNPQLELQLTKEENDALKKVIEQMKIDMETIVDKVTSTLREQNQTPKSDDGHTYRQQIRELESKVGSKESEIVRLKDERDRLIQISNDLRADLNRSQRLVNDLMNREMRANPVQANVNNDANTVVAGGRQTILNQNYASREQMGTPDEKKNYIFTDDHE